jgi:hypothetical protein
MYLCIFGSMSVVFVLIQFLFFAMLRLQCQVDFNVVDEPSPKQIARIQNALPMMNYVIDYPCTKQ